MPHLNASSGITATPSRASGVPSLRDRLRRNIAHFHAGLPDHWKKSSLSSSAIQPLICGESAAALKLSAKLREAGFLIPAIRYPSVPRHAARLRITLSAAHAPKAISALNDALAALAGK